MAPPSTKPVLSKIDPAQLASTIGRRMQEHVAMQALACGLTTHEGGLNDIELSVHCLAAYARDGVQAYADVHEYLVSLIPLWSAPLGDAPIDIADEADPDEEIGVVMMAALARETIAEGHPVSTARLAALASLSPRQVQQLVAAGELKGEDGTIGAAEARRWLSGRGVPGFAGKRGRR